MSFIPSFRRRELILAVRDGHRANENEAMIFISGVTTQYLPHDLLLYGPSGGCGFGICGQANRHTVKERPGAGAVLVAHATAQRRVPMPADYASIGGKRNGVGLIDLFGGSNRRGLDLPCRHR